MQLALGPLLYYWPRLTVFDFYQAAAEWPVDIVYLGESVCSRRHELRLSNWLPHSINTRCSRFSFRPAITRSVKVSQLRLACECA